jgi:ABC-type antimicrobial peptide transport system permease subunit
MFKNYLKIALRNLIRNKTYSLINISGLAVGMASVILIAMYVQAELSYDRFHQNLDHIYRVTVSSGEEQIPSWIGTPALLGPSFQQRFPEIEDFVRIDPFGFKNKTLILYGEKSFYEAGFVLADPALFRVFDFKLLQGESETVLSSRSSLVITKSIAEKYFGSDDPIGKALSYEGKLDFIVTGVMDDVPANSHLAFNFIAPFEYLNEIHQRDIMRQWGMRNYYTYVLLKDKADVKALEARSAQYFSELANSPDTRIYLQPVAEIHLRSKISRDPHHTGDITGVYLYAAIAVVILLIACINFMNLYTANSELRVREVGMRKVLGAHKNQLVFQFLGESFILSMIALPFAVLLVELALPAFNHIIEKTLNIEYAKNFALFAALILLTLVVGLVSGSYPAFFLSSFQPVKMLRRKFTDGTGGLKFRNVLVVFQFVVTIVIIAGALIINSQMQYVRNKKLGYDCENIVNVPIYGPETKTNYQIFRNEVLSHAKIVDATATSFTPSVERWREGLYFESRRETDEHMFYRISGDFNLLVLFGIELIAGRAFDRNIPTDLNDAFILNESAIKEIGWTAEEAIGKRFGSEEGQVIGVVKDFHFRSLRREMQPLAINVLPQMFQYVSIKIRPGDIPNTIGFLERTWKAINPGIPFEYYFINEEFDKLYKTDLKLQTLFGYFAFLAIFIACLGLLGLSLFTVQRRTKEIGIRKVLGASVSRIIALLSKDFVKLVLLANLIAWPAAYFAMNKWLQNFAYRIDIGWWMFALAGGLALLIAFVTVSAQAIKAALANPVEALRYE